MISYPEFPRLTPENHRITSPVIKQAVHCDGTRLRLS
jgi:hypothetical protein